uniref:Uncharacterized protein n=1 Tax=Arundo donax TaxID=35708 RepID=A0A0A9GTY7_ARUDO
MTNDTMATTKILKLHIYRSESRAIKKYRKMHLGGRQ